MINNLDFDIDDVKFILRCCFVVFEQGLLPECRDKKVLLHTLMSFYVDICKTELGVENDEIH